MGINLRKVFKDINQDLVEKFIKYHSLNPHVFQHFEDLAFEMKNSGRTKYSGWTIVNVLRWHYDLATDGDDEFKISNEYIALMVRLMIYKYPEFDSFFTTKQMKG